MMKYTAPCAECVRLQLEGVVADSWCPTIKNGKVQYYEFTDAPLMETPPGQDVLLF